MTLLRCLGLLLLAALSLPVAGAEGRHRIAVVYADGGELSSPTLQGIVHGIEAGGDVVVLRMPLQLADGYLAQHRSDTLIRLAHAGEGGIAVVFPDIGEPYRGVFSKIIEGIEEKTKSRVSSFAVGGNANPDELAVELRKQDIRVVIALGKHGLKAVSALDGKFEVVAGAVLSVGETEARNNTILSLAPDPALLFSRLKTLVPDSRRVVVIYDPVQNEWLIRHARIAARSQGLELLALPAGDLKAALKHYQEYFSASARGDALWLAQDSTTVDEATVLPLVLKESWERNLPLFSSSVAHVRRGALFALYPNNMEMGRLLADSALGYLGVGSKPSKGVLPLREVLAAVNVRTANHLGLRLRQQTFDLVLPEP